MPPQRVGFLRHFGLTTGMDFGHSGLEPGMVFEGTTGVNVLIYRFSSKWKNKEKDTCDCYCSNLCNDNIIFRGQFWKRAWKMTFLGLRQGQDLENRATHPHQEFPGGSPGGFRQDEANSLLWLAASRVGNVSLFCSVRITHFVAQKKKYFCHIINPLVNVLCQDRWLDIRLVFVEENNLYPISMQPSSIGLALRLKA